MTDDRDSRPREFALDILRKHPQIRYEHAVAAAEFSGLPQLPSEVFYQAVQELGIPRSEDVGSLAVEPAALSEATARLVADLEAMRRHCQETAALRAALEDMRRIVRAALE